MKKLLFSLLLISTASVSAQIEFERGYFVSNDGSRTEGLINNRGWNDNPRSFEFKSSDADVKVLKDINDVAEFGIYDAVTYVRADVDLDRSSDKLGTLSRDKNPIAVNERLFLRRVIGGKYSLYRYEQSGLNKFFFSGPDNVITPLVYKKYLLVDRDNPTGDMVIRENNQFRTQLYNALKCQDITLKDAERLKYHESDLERFFTKANACAGGGEVVKNMTKNRGNFRLSPMFGYTSQKIEVQRDPGYLSFSGSESGFTFGIEAEYVLPTNKNKWSVIIEPNLNTFKYEQHLITPSPAGNDVTFEYNYFSVPVGIRHYMFLNETSKLFASGVINFSFTTKSEWSYRTTTAMYVNDNAFTFGLGLGYNYKRISAEARYYMPHTVNPNAETDFSRLVLCVRYAILN